MSQGETAAGGLAPADAGFAARLERVVGQGVLSAPGPAYLEEPRGRWRGRGGVLARPRGVDEVAAILAACNAARVGVVAWGGGTGLVGGQVMPEGPAPVILSLERMAAIRALRPDENVLVAEAGAVLAEVQAAARAAGRLFPLSLASEGTARIGGLLATNAGGIGVLRYGNARELCLGLEAVLADGRVWHGLSRLRKDNTGYDLRNLLVGSEGTLGVITAASLRLSPVPAAVGTAFLAVAGPAAALDLLGLARARFGEAVSAFELIAREGFAFLSEAMPEVRQPFATPPEWAVLVEVGLPRGLDPAEGLAALFDEAAGAGLARDGVIASSGAQRAAFWALREAIPEANRRIGAISSHDIALPLGELAGFIAEAGPALAALGEFRINCFGHLGDGNLHYNVFPPRGGRRADHDGVREAVKTLVHDMVHARGGSVSAEHGIGRLKVADLERYGDPVKRALMREIKRAFDPVGILNPGAVLRREG